VLLPKFFLRNSRFGGIIIPYVDGAALKEPLEGRSPEAQRTELLHRRRPVGLSLKPRSPGSPCS
jgi:hypothetical protein